MSIELAWTPAPATEEDRLALRTRSGDLAAFDHLVARYHPRLYRFAYRMLHSASDAEDAVQETFVRAYKALPHYRPDGYFSSWIYRIALNECRRRSRQRRDDLPLLDDHRQDTGPDPGQAVLNMERRRQVQAALDALPEHYRLVVELFYFSGLSTAEVGRALGITATAVKVRLFRARQRLSHVLEGVA